MRHRLMTLLALLAPALAAAHDLWISPSEFTPRPGQTIGVHLEVGVDFVGEPVPRIPMLVKQFVIADSARQVPVPGRAGADPAGQARISGDGLHVIGYHSHPSRIELPAEKFDAYLVDEGLEFIRAQRAAQSSIGAPVRELFSRNAKSLVLAGAPDAAQHDLALGFELELVAERNPYALPEGEAMPVRLLYQGRALAGALVIAINRSRPSERIAHRSDAEGRVRLPLQRGGMWLVKAVHMVSAAEGTNADWASHWASLTFGS